MNAGRCSFLKPDGMPCGNPVPESIEIQYHEGDYLGGGFVVGKGAGFKKSFWLCGDCAKHIAATTKMPEPGDTFTAGEP